LRVTVLGARRKIVIRLAGDRHQSALRWVLVLPVTAPRPIEIPPVLLDALDDFADLHNVGTLSALLSMVNPSHAEARFGERERESSVEELGRRREKDPVRAMCCCLFTRQFI